MRKRLTTFLKFIFLFQLFVLGFFMVAQNVEAANCGGATVCACGDTVTSSYTLLSDMVCTGDGLVVGTDGITIDGKDPITGINHTITGDGDGSGISNYVYYGEERGEPEEAVTDFTIKDLNITNFQAGIFLSSSTGSTIQNVTANSNITWGIRILGSSSNDLIGNTANLNTHYGIFLESYPYWDVNWEYIEAPSSLNTLTNNTANSNTYGIRLDNSSSSNTLTGNTANSNTYGIFIGSSSNILTGNTISNNMREIYDVGTNTYSSNHFLHNAISKMLTFVETTRAKDVGEQIDFSISAFNWDGTDCDNCTTITTSPSEAVTKDTEAGNDITGHFTPTKSGIYSLTFTVTENKENPNTTKRKILFFVGDTDSQATKYYLRGVDSTHGQPVGTDYKTLLLTAPTSTEEWECGGVVTNLPDDIPNYPLANLSAIDIYSWYKQESASGGSIWVQKYVNYNDTINPSNNPSSISVPAKSVYTWTGDIKPINFTNLNWAMDYPWIWYWIAFNLYGTNPHWTTFPAGYSDRPSYANFTYQYTTTPIIKSISNTDINVLSATEPANDPDNASLVLDGTGSTNIVLDNYKRPFQGYTTTISSDGTSTIAANNLTGETTINSVKMDITPDAGSMDVSIVTWNTSGSYYKQWTETGTGVSSAAHTVGNLLPNTYYTVKVGGSRFNTYQSNASGEITFTYSGPYSTKTFELTASSACENTIDDDNDGLIDYPNDSGCTSYDDSDETDPMYGGGGRARSQTPTPAAETTDIQSEIARIQTLIADLQAKLKNLLGQPLTAGIQGIPANFQFTTNLKPKDVNDDIKYLQIILNSDPDTKLTQSGPGSPGKETNLFGPLTKQAVIKFQEKYSSEILAPWGLTKGTGFVGTAARAKINSLMGR